MFEGKKEIDRLDGHDDWLQFILFTGKPTRVIMTF